jgi:hypothetical protein
VHITIWKICDYIMCCDPDFPALRTIKLVQEASIRFVVINNAKILNRNINRFRDIKAQTVQYYSKCGKVATVIKLAY